MSNKPIVRMQNQLSQFLIGLFRQIRARFTLTINDLIDAPIGTIMNTDFSSVASLHIVPVDHPGVAVGTITQIEDLRSLVTR